MNTSWYRKAGGDGKIKSMGYTVFVVVIFCAVLITVIFAIWNRKRSKKERENAISGYINDCMNVKKTHEILCRSAEGYISEYYIFDVRIKLNAYKQKMQDHFKQLETWTRIISKYEKGKMWREVFYQAQSGLFRARREQEQFFDLLHMCEMQKEDYRTAFVKSQQEMYSQLYNQFKQDDDDIGLTLFKGCTDYESLKKRYDTLMKMYHPDNPNGNHEMATKITEAYHTLKRKYQS